MKRLLNIKKIVLMVLLTNIVLLSGCSFNNADSSKIDTKKFKELEKYVYEVEYTSLDYEAADSFYASTNDNWGGGCSAISKMVDGHRLIGRNMDLNITNKNAFIVRTNAGKYKTIGLAFTFRDYSPDYEDVNKKGFSNEFYKCLPFMCDDVLNDAGLHIEINMRHGEFWPNGEDKYSCSGTNPDSSIRVYMFEIPRYVGENCSTVEEAKEYISTLDVYSKDDYWNYCYLISDAKGNSSVLEFSDNNVYWLDEDKIDSYDWLASYNTQAICQTNFYINENDYMTQDIKSGEGRYISLQEGIGKVNSKSDMYNLMKKVQFSNYYLDYDECKNNYFDPRSELIGEIPVATYDLIMNSDNEDVVREAFNELNDEYRKMTRQERQNENKFWESTFTEVVDTTTKEIFVRFFENENMLYLIGFNGTNKVNNISEWE